VVGLLILRSDVTPDRYAHGMTATPPEDNGSNGQQQGWGQTPPPGHGAGGGNGPSYGPSYGQPGQPGYEQPGPYYQPPQPMRPEDQRLWATLVHVGGILFSFVPPLIGYLVLRDRGEFVKEHTRQALNFQLTMLIGYIGGAILTVVVIGGLISLATWVVVIIFGVQAAIAANQGRFFRYPLTIEFFKH
jgi:uncharacterized protein